MSTHSETSLSRLLSVSDVDAAAVFGAAGREALLAGVTSRRVRAPRRRRRLVLAVAVLALAGIATAGTWAVLRAPARETTSVQCLIGSSDAVIPSMSGDPVADCVANWRQEYGTTPPPLQAYDNGLGGVTVIPRSQKPQAGWTPIQSQDVALIELQNSLDDYVNGLNSSCLSASAATALTEARLAQFGLAGWTVTVRDPGSADAPGMCTDVDDVEPGTQTVTLIATQPSTAPGTVDRLAAKLRPITQACDTLPEAVAAVRAAGDSLGLSPAPPATVDSYDLSTTTDDTLRCASVYETVGGTIFIAVRGPTG